MERLPVYAPMAGYGLLAVGFLYLILKYKRRHDLAAWVRLLRQTAERAGTDERFRSDALADAERELEKLPASADVTPVTRRQEACLQILPKVMLMTGLCGVFFLFMGLFRPYGATRGVWEIYAGPVFLLLTAAIYVYLEKIRPHYARVQLMNRKYLLQKAAGDQNSIATLTEILRYYPVVPELWMEKADALATAGRMDEAVVAIRQAVDLSPKNIDLAVVEVSFQLRNGSLDGAEKALGNVWNLKKAPTDPRPDLYAGVIALRRGDTAKALEHGGKAVSLDKGFIERFIPRDVSLKEMEAFLKANKLL